jgi:DNA-binding FadR family transcriptional regulator
MRRAIDAPLEYIEVDLRFHRALMEASHNPLFPLVLEPVAALMRESRLVGMHAPNAPRRSIQSHEHVVAAIRERDPVRAKRVMREHFDKVAAFIAEAEALGERDRR